MFERFVKNKCFLFVLMFLVIHMAAGPGFYSARAAEKIKVELEEKFVFAETDISTDFDKISNEKPYSEINNFKSSSELLEEKIN